MAINQYTFHILPKESTTIISPDYNFEKDKDGLFEDSHYWELNPQNKSLFSKIKNILPENKSWSKNIDLYGNQESNCFEIYHDNDIVLSASFRIDFTSDYEPIVTKIIDYCLQNGLIILDENLKMTELDLNAIKATMTNSPQLKKYILLSQ